MGLCASKTSVAGSPARYTTHITETTPSQSSSPSRQFAAQGYAVMATDYL
ncbi:avirulence protein, partial [Xanthomonas campestris pv. campestris]|nr:avirulence protein [Xanthomonas campestris pv. campestris]MEB1337408.1 avirulence protein [Xanthomonas campestris pv. campestris]